MKKKTYIIIIAILASISVIMGTYIVMERKFKKPQVIKEEIIIDQDRPEGSSSGGIVVETKPKEKIDIDNPAGTSASEYKNFEDTIDELIKETR